MRIHDNEIIENAAIQTIIGLQLGLTEEDIAYSIEQSEALEMYEECQGMLIGLEYFKSKVFNCRVSQIKLGLDD